MFVASLVLSPTESDLRFFFFFNDTATTEIYTLSLHDALPICGGHAPGGRRTRSARGPAGVGRGEGHRDQRFTRLRSEEHTSELQSPCNLVCRLLLEKKKKVLDEVILREQESRLRI